MTTFEIILSIVLVIILMVLSIWVKKLPKRRFHSKAKKVEPKYIYNYQHLYDQSLILKELNVHDADIPLIVSELTLLQSKCRVLTADLQTHIMKLQLEKGK